jgi:hypothetical protein
MYMTVPHSRHQYLSEMSELSSTVLSLYIQWYLDMSFGQVFILQFQVACLPSKGDLAALNYKTSVIDWFTFARYEKICQNTIPVWLRGRVGWYAVLIPAQLPASHNGNLNGVTIANLFEFKRDSFK